MCSNHRSFLLFLTMPVLESIELEDCLTHAITKSRPSPPISIAPGPHTPVSAIASRPQHSNVLGICSTRFNVGGLYNVSTARSTSSWSLGHHLGIKCSSRVTPAYCAPGSSQLLWPRCRLKLLSLSPPCCTIRAPISHATLNLPPWPSDSPHS